MPNANRTRSPRYASEDVTETTAKEIRGWYTYSAAAEIFSVGAVGSFLPVTLEQLARENGVKWSDRTTPCTTKATPPSDAVNSVVKFLLKRADDRDNQCIIKPFGVELTTASFAMYTFSLAVFIQALSLVSFSSVADHGSYRKKLLIGFGVAGSTSAMLFLLVVPKIYLVGPILVIIGVTCLGSSNVLLNSFLPLLVLNHRDAQGSSIPLTPASPAAGDRSSEEGEEFEIVPNNLVKKSDSADLKLSSQISSKGVGIGYSAAVFVQILSIMLLIIMSKRGTVSTTLPLRMVLFLVGLCWFLLTIPSSMWLRTRPGPPLEDRFVGTGRWCSFWNYSIFAWKSLWKTIKIGAKLRQVVVFLVAWFLLSDASATVSGTAILFARTELKLGTVAVALLSITATGSGIVGALIWPIISRKFKLQTNQTIVACIVLMEAVPFYGLLGYVPFIQRWGVGGLQQPWEIYPLALVYGIDPALAFTFWLESSLIKAVMGGLSSYCRAFFGRLIPPGQEAAFYALYAITDKGSSAVGPAIVGKIIDVSGHIRPAFIFLAVLIALPGPLIWFVDVKRGEEDAIRMAKTMKSNNDTTEGDNEGDEWQEAEVLLRDHN